MTIASAEVLLDTYWGRKRHVTTLKLQNILSGHFLACFSFSFPFLILFLGGVGWIVLPEEEGTLINTSDWVLNLRKPGDDKRKPCD